MIFELPANAAGVMCGMLCNPGKMLLPAVRGT